MYKYSLHPSESRAQLNYCGHNMTHESRSLTPASLFIGFLCAALFISLLGRLHLGGQPTTEKSVQQVKVYVRLIVEASAGSLGEINHFFFLNPRERLLLMNMISII